MGYPQTASGAAPGYQSPPPTAAQEPMSVVLSQAFSQLNDLENKLAALRDRIESRSQLNKDPGTPPVSGMLNQALSIRNISARLLDRCGELESLL